MHCHSSSSSLWETPAPEAGMGSRCPEECRHQFWGSVAPGCSQTPRLCSWSPHLGSFQGAPSAAPLPRAGKGRGLFLRRLCLAGGLPGVSRALHPPCRQGCLPCTFQLPQHQQVWGSNMELWMDHCHPHLRMENPYRKAQKKAAEPPASLPEKVCSPHPPGHCMAPTGLSFLPLSTKAGIFGRLLPPTPSQGLRM